MDYTKYRIIIASAPPTRDLSQYCRVRPGHVWHRGCGTALVRRWRERADFGASRASDDRAACPVATFASDTQRHDAIPCRLRAKAGGRAHSAAWVCRVFSMKLNAPAPPLASPLVKAPVECRGTAPRPCCRLCRPWLALHPMYPGYSGRDRRRARVRQGLPLRMGNVEITRTLLTFLAQPILVDFPNATAKETRHDREANRHRGFDRRSAALPAPGIDPNIGTRRRCRRGSGLQGPSLTSEARLGKRQGCFRPRARGRRPKRAVHDPPARPARHRHRLFRFVKIDPGA